MKTNWSKQLAIDTTTINNLSMEANDAGMWPILPKLEACLYLFSSNLN